MVKSIFSNFTCDIKLFHVYCFSYISCISIISKCKIFQSLPKIAFFKNTNLINQKKFLNG